MTSRRSSGSMRAESAVEPTKSENITVTWRRSARSSGVRSGHWTWSLRQRRAPCRSHRHAEQRWHRAACGGARRAATPSSFRSSSVRLGRTVSSISFSRNAASYFPRPRLRSQTTTSMMAPELRLGAYHRRSGPERSWAASGSESARGSQRLLQVAQGAGLDRGQVKRGSLPTASSAVTGSTR